MTECDHSRTPRPDIIYYGLDLAEYMHREFDEVRGEADESSNPRATVRFWRDLL